MRTARALAAVALLVAAAAFLLPGKRDEDADRARRDAGPAAGERGAGGRPHLPAAAPPAAPAAREAGAPSDPAILWRLVGRVRTPSGAPVAGARVETWLERGSVRTPIGEAVSDGEGAYVLDLEALRRRPASHRATGRLGAASYRAGCRPSDVLYVEPLAVEAEDPRTFSQDFTLEAGVLVRGRVVGEDGEPVAGAIVSLRPLDPSAPPLSHVVSDPAGRYRLGAPPEGDWFVHAVENARGEARSEAIRPDAEAVLLDVPDLVLRAAAWLGGRVRWSDDTPVEDVGLYATPLGPPAGDEHPGSPGSWQPHARSGPDGRFRMPLPRGEGRWRIHLQENLGTRRTWEAAAGDEDVDVVLDVHRLRIRAIDEDGAPLPGTGISAFVFVREHGAAVLARGLGETGKDTLAGAADAALGAGIDDPEGRLDLLVPTGSVVLLSAGPDDWMPAEEVVRVPETPGTTSVDLVLRQRVPRGRLRVAVLDESGKPIPSFVVALHSRLGSVVAEEASDASGALSPLPSGRWRMEVHPGAATASWRRGLDLANDWLSESRVVEIPEGGVAEETIRARRGGRVRLAVRVPAGGPELDGRLRARPANGGEERTLLLIAYDLPEGQQITSRMHADVPGLAVDLLEPGDWILRLVARGYAPLEARVRVDPGVVTDVEMEPKPE